MEKEPITLALLPWSVMKCQLPSSSQLFSDIEVAKMAWRSLLDQNSRNHLWSLAGTRYIRARMSDCSLCEILHVRGAPDCPASRIGQIIDGKYKLLSLIGVGGMGAVYKAEHLSLGTSVALKMIHAHISSHPHAIARFEQEARRAAAIKHPGIVKVLHLGTTQDGESYMEMELLAGTPLDELLEEGPLSVERAIAITTQALSALAAAHAQDVVHRDLKPENLFVSVAEDGVERVVLLDFGIAKALQGAAGESLTHTGTILGSPLYMSPEQIADAKGVDQRSDIYGMGAVLFELLTNTRPVSGDSLAEVLANVMTGRVQRHPRQIREELPAWLDAVVARAMENAPADRYTSAIEMSAALDSQQRSACASQIATKAMFGEATAPPVGLSAGELPHSQMGAMGPAMRSQGGPESSLTQDLPSSAALSTPTPSFSPISPARPRWHWGAGAVAVGLAAAATLFLSHTSESSLPDRMENSNGADHAQRNDAEELAPQDLTEPPNMEYIAGATFSMGSSPSAIEEALQWCESLAPNSCRRDLYEREQPVRKVTVSGFFMDKYEVTNKDFARWLNTVGPISMEQERLLHVDGVLVADLHPGYSRLTWHGETVEVNSGGESLPVVQVTWDAARMYCAAKGKRLSTEAEWARAARGPSGNSFPWGDDRAVSCSEVAFGRGSKQPCGTDNPGPKAVGSSSKDRSEDGVYDLGGNAAEWVADRFRPRYDDSCGDACVDPLVSSPSEEAVERVLRGGYFDGLAETLRSAGRSRALSNKTLNNVGFRCARNEKEYP